MRTVGSCCLILVLTCMAQQPQRIDGKPRVYFETGPPSELFSEADLQQHSNSFGETFPSYCPGAVVTRERGKANYVVRLGLAGNAESQTLDFSMAIFQRDGDQVFADTANHSPGTSTSELGNPEILLTREACAAIVYRMDQDTIFMLTQQSKRRLLRVGVQVKYHLSPKKLPNDKVRQIEEASLAKATEVAFRYGFPLRCFCTTTKLGDQADASSQLDYRFEVDMGENWLSLVVFDASGNETFPRNKVDEAQTGKVLNGACQAIALRESASLRP